MEARCLGIDLQSQKTMCMRNVTRRGGGCHVRPQFVLASLEVNSILLHDILRLLMMYLVASNWYLPNLHAERSFSMQCLALTNGHMRSHAW